jgi:diaminohydroxyphosphoribosylaminopyrimidine deaminase/5-amino-6-(5-phosphoribosylamino)uracil reductase
MRSREESYMLRAFELAQKGTGIVSPNPMVGCVIVHEDKIIGEGYHHKYGGPHAEVEAVNSVLDKSLLSESTAYVTLEPCSHFGKTPPCCDLLIAHGFKRVVIANVDPNPQVRGKGISKMQAAGIDISTGVFEELGLKLNRRFFTFHEKRRPFIILKWAQTRDGFIARENFDSKWISGTRSRQWVHKWRAEEDAILVGKNTALYDDPSLTTRDWEGTDPIRIVLDHKRVLNSDLKLFSDGNQTRRVVEKNAAMDDDLAVGSGEDLTELLSKLYQDKIQSVIVEGGRRTLQQFIDLDLWDEARVFYAPIIFEKGILAPVLSVSLFEEFLIGNDKLIIYENKKA